MQIGFTLRLLTPDDVPAYRRIRHESLALAPMAFGMSLEEETAFTDAEVSARICGALNAFFGAWVDGVLVGVAGFVGNDRVKQCHKALMVGVYVRPAWRGPGIASGLVGCIIAHARGRVAVVQASVVVGNEAALRIYEAHGFVRYGLERQALCVDGIYCDEYLIALPLQDDPTS